MDRGFIIARLKQLEKLLQREIKAKVFVNNCFKQLKLRRLKRSRLLRLSKGMKKLKYRDVFSHLKCKH